MQVLSEDAQMAGIFTTLKAEHVQGFWELLNK